MLLQIHYITSLYNESSVSIVLVGLFSLENIVFQINERSENDIKFFFFFDIFEIKFFWRQHSNQFILWLCFVLQKKKCQDSRSQHIY